MTAGPCWGDDRNTTHPVLNAAVLVEHSARDHPGCLALVFEGRELSYGELDAAINRAAGGLAAAGLGPGDHIALCSLRRPRRF